MFHLSKSPRNPESRCLHPPNRAQPKVETFFFPCCTSSSLFLPFFTFPFQTIMQISPRPLFPRPKITPQIPFQKYSKPQLAVYYSLMNTFRKINTATIQTRPSPSTPRKLKSKRNNSMPDLTNLAQDYQRRSKEKLKYNKWYIKPELRLKTSINSEPEFKDTADRFAHYYESLYNTPPNFQNECSTQKNSKTVRMSLAEQLCADLQNIRMLITFKSKKQGGRRRVPGVIDYFLKFREKEEVEEKKTYLKRRKIAA